MSKKIFITLVLTIFVSLGFGLRAIFAQKYNMQQSMVSDNSLIIIEEKLDRVLSKLDKQSDTKMLEKLDQILKNQDNIRQQLNIIRIRASR